MADPHFMLLYFCLLLILLKCSSFEFGIRFTDWPDSEVIAIPGTQVVFSCSTNVTADKVGWLYNHHRLYPQQHQQQKQPKDQRAIRPHHQQQDFTIKDTTHGSQLTVHLRSINYKHQLGLYQCVAHLGSAAVTSLPGRLSAATLAPFTTRAGTSQLTVLEGGPARLPCRPPFSVPKATIAFLKNGLPLETDNSTSYRISPHGDLLIKELKTTDQGSYKCRAHNSALGAWHSSPRTIVITVGPRDDQTNTTPPQIVYPRPARNPQHRQRGSSVHMLCLASGNPAPKITWTRYGNQLPQKAVIGPDGSLILDNLDLQDQGTYLCHANNGVGPEDRINVNVDVIELPTIQRIGEVQRQVQEGGSVLVRCSMTGHPVPDVMWVFNGRKLINDGNIFIDGPKIKIVSVAKKHDGIYQCFASNIGGWSETSILVQVVPRDAHVTSEHSLYDDYVEEDFTINHDLNNGRQNKDWNREGKLKAKRRNQWNNHRTKNENLPRGDDLILDNGEEQSLQKISNDDEGTMVPPSAPNVTKISDDSVMVTWAAPTPSGLSILFYKVQYRELKNNRGGRSGRWKTVEEDIPSHVTSYEVTELKAGNFYKFRIAAVYTNQDNNIGPTSKRFLLEKDPTMSPPLYPPNVTSVERLTASSIQLKWAYETTPGIDVLGFFISYREATNAGSYTKVTVLGNDTTSFVVTNLKANISYDFKIQGFNLAGTSDFSSVAKRFPSGLEVMSSPAPPPSVSSPEVVRSTADLKLQNFHLYLILGGLLAALVIIVIICYAVYSCKNKQHQVSRAPSMYEDTSLHIHREASTYRLPENHSGGESTNGYLPHQEKHITHEIAEKISIESSLVDNNNAHCFSSRRQVIVPEDGQTSVHHTPSQTDITLDRRKHNSDRHT